jgi:putative restriction endonuclease
MLVNNAAGLNETSCWWVNHAQSSRYEISRGYVWSPATESNGAKSHFYDNMRMIRPSDQILSYAGGRVGHVGTATAFPSAFAKPEALDNIGNYWGQYGWLIPVEWRALRSPVKPADIIADLRPYLAPRYSPIRSSNGWGNQKAYMSRIDPSILSIVLEAGEGVSVKATNKALDVGQERASWDDKISATIFKQDSLTVTEREQIVLARRGQGRFRLNVLALMDKCALTGLRNPSLLTASHIKPWRMCEDSNERLDGFNGLMLSPNVDRLFDAGLITFDSEGRPKRSSMLKASDIHLLGLQDSMANGQIAVATGSQKYFEYHRSNVFVP